MKNKPMKKAGFKLVRRFQSMSYKTLFGIGDGVKKYNTHMEYLVELPTGQRVFMSKKEVKQLNLI